MLSYSNWWPLSSSSGGDNDSAGVRFEVLDMLDMMCQKAGGQRLSLVQGALVLSKGTLLLLNRNSYYQKGTHQKGTLIL